MFLNASTVDIWRIFLDAPEQDGQNWARHLSAEECNRSQLFKCAIQKRRFDKAHGALRVILASYTQIDPQKLRIEISKKGKPALDHEGLSIHFNLSHSGDFALCAVSLSPVGVDIEKSRPLHSLEALSKRFFCLSEHNYIMAQAELAHRQDAFFKIWTAKEAVLKGLGVGIGNNLHNTEIAVSQAQGTQLLSLCGSDSLAAEWRLQELSLDAAFYGNVALKTGEDFFVAVHEFATI